MSNTKTKEASLAEAISSLFKVLGIQEIPESVIKQLAFRMGGKPNPTFEDKFKRALGSIKVTPSKSYIHPEVIDFDIQESGGGVRPKESDFFNGHAFQLSDVNQDLFTFAEFIQLSLGTGNVSGLRTPSGYQTLHKIISTFLEKCDMGLDKGGFSVDDKVTKYFQNICLAAQRSILGKSNNVDSKNVEKYQKSLEIQNALISFRAIGKRDLLDAKVLLEIPFVAEKAIEIIMNAGFEHGESVAIYNRRFGCAYEPLFGIAVVCAKCYEINRFEKIKFTEKCGVCKENLFRKCHKPECGTLIPRNINACPTCGVREVDYEQFTNNISSAKSFISKGYIEQAEMCLASAQAIAPYRETEINDLKKNIDRSKADRNNILSEIDKLTNRRAFFAAAKKLADSKKILPSECWGNIELRIVTAQNNADKIFATANRKVEELQKVLAICVDHPGALERIAKIPPEPPNNLTINENDGYIQLSWDVSSEIGVNYRVVRKKSSRPETAFDGDVVEETDKPFAQDMAPIPGKIHYAVFTERGGNFSDNSAHNSLAYLPEVSGLSLRQLDDRVEISYRTPKGISGVRVDRKTNGKTTNIYNGTKTIATDRDFPEQCSYIVTALFDNRESKGKTIPFTASILPEGIDPQIHTEQNRIFVSWDTVQKGFDVKICELTQGQFVPEAGRIYIESELSEKTRELVVSTCEELNISLDVKPNHEHTLIVVIGNSNGWLCCGVFPIYAGVYPKVKRIPHIVGLKGEHYFLFEGSLPANVSEFSYAISKENKMPTLGDFKPGNMEGYSGIDKPTIRVQNMGQVYVGSYFIFCKFKLNNGKETAPVCSEVHFRQDIQVQVNLKNRGINLKGDIRIKLLRYDFEGYAEFPDLHLMVGNTTYEVSKFSVSPVKTDYVCPMDVQLSAPISRTTEIKLVPVDLMLISDFTINYKY